MRRIFCVFLTLFFLSALSAQEESDGEPVKDFGGENSADSIFPLSLVLEDLEYARRGGLPFNTWRPDWPPDLPPDAFYAPGAFRVTLEQDGAALTYALDSEGRTVEFPAALNGGVAQARVEYGLLYGLSEMTLSFPWPAPEAAASREGAVETGEAITEDAAEGEEFWRFEFLEYRGSFPALVRASRKSGASRETWYFISLSRGGGEISEIWYDEQGAALGAYGFSLGEAGGARIRAVRDYSDPMGGREYYYDSRGLLVEYAGPEGRGTALYNRKDLPRYSKRLPPGEAGTADAAGAFSFQWDAGSLLVRLSGGHVDCRYDYTLNERGGWIERRETRMIRAMGHLLPSAGKTVRRVLEYRE